MKGGNAIVREEASLQHDEAFLQSLVANTPDGVLTIDGEGIIVFANPAVEGILGYAPADLLGSHVERILPKGSHPPHEAELERALESGSDPVSWTAVESTVSHETGHEVPVAVSLQAHRHDGERYVTGVLRDVTDRKRREEIRREQTRELEEFAAVLSHDLRNPLTVAEGYLDLAEPEDDEELQQVADALERMRQIIDDTLTQARYGRVDGQTEVISFDEVMSRAWAAVPTAEASLVLPETSWRIRARESRLRQLVENLVRNAVEHAGPKATLRIGVMPAGAGFYVEDDGPGLPDPVRSRLMTARGVDHERGEGYGLPIVHRVADEHGWEVQVTDAATGGARFEFHGARVYAQ